MAVDQARQVLNLEKNEVNMERIAEQFNKYYAMNDPDKGGSFYIQAKVANARDSLVADVRRMEKLAAKQAAGEEAGSGKDEKLQ